jgi:hypothetical protein
MNIIRVQEKLLSFPNTCMKSFHKRVSQLLSLGELQPSLFLIELRKKWANRLEKLSAILSDLMKNIRNLLL